MTDTLIDSGGQNLVTFAQSTTEPIAPIAGWCCIRSTLESCALAAWILDPNINYKQRIKRVLAFRFEGMNQQLKFAHAVPSYHEFARSIDNEILETEESAVDMGFSKVKDKHGKRIGIGQIMPSATELIDNTLSEAAAYRILSSVSHGHTWAITRLCYISESKEGSQSAIGGIPVNYVRKAIHVDRTIWLGFIGARALSRVVWYEFTLRGRAKQELKGLLERTFDHLRAPADSRFWRS